MEQRISLVTLAVSDLDATRRFYLDGLGWNGMNLTATVGSYILAAGVLVVFQLEMPVAVCALA